MWTIPIESTSIDIQIKKKSLDNNKSKYKN